MNDNPLQNKSWLERLTKFFHREPYNRKDLLQMLTHAKDRQLLNKDAFEMITGALNVTETQVRDVMIPRIQMVTVNHDQSPQEVLPIIIESTHSRFPVIGENRDEIIGILLAKDLLKYTIEEKHENIKIKQLTRPAIFVPESKRLDVLLKEFRLNRNHMAIIVDEYGSIAGLITIEDVLEQIVGSIEDEHDISSIEPNIKQLNQDEYTVKAITPIAEFNDYFKCQINPEDFDTIGGYIMQKSGHLPKRGESVQSDSLIFTVIVANRRRIQLLKVKIKK